LARGDPIADQSRQSIRHDERVEFDFDERVRVRRTARTMADGTAGLTGHVAGKSQDGGGPVQAYAVYLTERDRVYSIEPADLIIDGP
jgi:hypothetical protein